MTTPPQQDSGWHRLWAVATDHSTRSIREKADYILFFIGIGVEYILLSTVIFHHADHGEFPMKIIDGLFLVPLFAALIIHQFLIFRNFSLHGSLSKGKFAKHELWICLLFGVLTGEVGYLYVLAKCNFPDIWIVKPLLKCLDLLFAPDPNKFDAVIWDFPALGSALKGVFALGAVLLSVTILAWDFRAAESFKHSADSGPSTLRDESTESDTDVVVLKKSYTRAVLFFFSMDLIACVVWLVVLGAVVPNGRMGMKASSWAQLLNYMALIYFFLAVLRLFAASATLEKLKVRTNIHNTVI